MIEIKHKITGVVLIDINRADLREADLCRANLHGADLHGADLHAKQYILRIQGSRHEINVIDSDVRIGCKRYSLNHWLKLFASIGESEGYTPAQITEYGLHLSHIKALLDARGISTCQKRQEQQ